MPDRSPGRTLAVCAVAMLASLAWVGRAQARDPQVPPSASAANAPVEAPASVPQTATDDPDKDKLAPNSIYAEGLGAALLYSFNYERMMLDQLGVRVGFSYLSIGASASAGGSSASSSATFVWVPITASYVGIRYGRSALELGGGATILYVSAATSSAGVSSSGAGLVPYGVAMVGYRFQPVGHAGFMFRVGFNTLVAPGLGLQNASPGTLGVIPWPYISLGASF